MPLAVVPMNVPLSSVTTGQVLSVEGEAKTVAVATQTGISNARRKTMSTREKDGQENHKGGRGVASREGRPQTLNWEPKPLKPMPSSSVVSAGNITHTYSLSNLNSIQS